MNDTICSLIAGTVAQRLRSFESLHTSELSHGHSEHIEQSLISDIASLKTVLAHFKRHLNIARSPIIRLPPEILHLIIADSIQPFEDEDEAEYETRSSLRWMYLGRVSHRFRTILLSSHTFWGDSVAYARTPSAFSSLLERARNAPVKLNIGHCNSLLATNDLASQYLERARAIHATDTYGYSMRAITDHLSTGIFPHLEILDISAYHMEMDPQPESGAFASQASGPHAYHPSAVRFPKLRSLSLFCVFLPFEASSLTSLSLKGPFSTGNPDLLTAGQFVDILRRCVNLQDLVLSCYMPELGSSDGFRRPSRIQLPALRSLSIGDARDRILSLWSIIDVPTSTTLELDLLVPPNSPGNLISHIEGSLTFASHTSRILSSNPALTTRLEIQGSDAISGLSFNLMVPQQGPRDRFSQYPNYPQEEAFAHRSILDFTAYPDDWDASDIQQSIPRFVVAYGLSQVRSLETSQDILDALEDAPRTLLTLFPSLEVLVVLEIHHDFLQEASEGTELLSSHPSGVLLHPKVQSLALWSTSSCFSAEHIRRLATLLASRLETHVPIHALELALDVEPGSDGKYERLLCQNMLAPLVIPGPLILMFD
ncbi:unnamed protein product [Peniophora sp. CBMAI 1063]|nr:unnamed protein product [Peniophora sp. CBMAI 1063]